MTSSLTSHMSTKGIHNARVRFSASPSQRHHGINGELVILRFFKRTGAQTR